MRWVQAYFRHRRRLKAQALRSEGHADAVAKKEAELQALTKQFTESTEAIKSLHAETLIRGWVSNEEAAAARRAASHGYLRDLRAIKAERTFWEKATILIFWMQRVFLYLDRYALERAHFIGPKSYRDNECEKVHRQPDLVELRSKHL